MSECSSKGTCGKSSCEGCSQNTAKGPQSMQVKENAHSRVKKVIGVVSGKGGVGKSMVTSLLAVAMNRKGYKTAIMDADITGPSIPTAFGLNDHAVANDDGLLPEVTKNGIKVMSLNLLLEDQTDPVVWRGPIISGTVSQFWTEVCWGDVDYMFVDMPPGTGDVALTVFQSLPLAGIVIVTSPQELVSMIVTKAVKMAEMMNVPVLGIREYVILRMSGLWKKAFPVWNKPYRKNSSRARHLSNRLPAVRSKDGSIVRRRKDGRSPRRTREDELRKDEQRFIN